MIEYGDPPSDQMKLELPGLSDDGFELMADAREWRLVHNVPEWAYYMALARRLSENGGKASPNYCLQSMRNEYRVSVPNAYAAPLARIAMEEDDRVVFRLAASKVDGFTKAVLR